jgi:SNF2 family DNA or RNA helicase
VFGGGVAPQFPALATRCAHILALTGTPLPNRPREAYTLCRGLCLDAVDFMSEDTVRERFNPSIKRETPDGKVYIDERTGRHGELQSRLRANFMVRRDKHGDRGVGYQLGDIQMPAYDIIQIEEDGPIKQALKAEKMLDIDPAHLPGPDEPGFGAIATVRRQMGVAIAPHAAEYVEMCLLGGEEKMVVFGHHIEVLDIIEARLGRYGVVRIDGRTRAQNKQAKVDQFRQDPRLRICLGNLISMGTGTDGLQDVASHAVFAEADWTPGVNQQGVDRLDRGGQRAKVQADFLVAPNSFAERILSTALVKLSTTTKALDARIGV